MQNVLARVPSPVNEPVLSYAPGSSERAALKAELERQSSAQVELPLWIGGEELRTGRTAELRMPHQHRHVLGVNHEGDATHAAQAIESALAAKRDWSERPFAERAAIFLRAADLLATTHRARINAATMLGQSKTAHQAEIDAACELADFLRFNVAFAERLLNEQPISPALTWNQLDYRPLDGFVYAISPFNFTAIGGNLATAPALLGNVVLWKPAATAVLSNFVILDVLREAGLPPGVINFVPGDPVGISQVALAHPELGGIHFTGSTSVFQSLWRSVGENVARYRQYPRLVGETGGKDFVVAHPSAVDDLEALAVALVRGAFEYQGQKCSAASRAYVPASLWPTLKARLLELVSGLRMGDVRDFRNFLGAVIDERAYRRIASYVELARSGPATKVLTEGAPDAREGYFVPPTIVESSDPRHRLMTEEIFGPVLTVFVYPDAKWEETLAEVDAATPYALTGAVFSRDRAALATASRLLRNAAGNFYVNDKPTGAVVGQQPFGGGRASGTNDKAGSLWNLVRWTSPRTIKETFVSPTQVGYPFLGAE